MSNKHTTREHSTQAEEQQSRTRRTKNFMLTWNNFHKWSKECYTKAGIEPKEQAFKFIEDRSKMLEFEYVFQIEGYGKNQTPHLQIYIECDKPKHFRELNFPSGVHIEKRKSNRGLCIAYCTDVVKRKWNTTPYFSEGMANNIQEDTLIILPNEFYPWQKKLYPVALGKPCRRTIHWFWDVMGATGKTEFIRHLKSFNNALLIQGSAEDIKHAVAKRIKDTGINPIIVILELTRSMDKPVSYEGLEIVKSGVFTSTKYNHFEVNMNPPHLFVFSNWEPRTGALSNDRWAVHEICSQELDFIDHFYGNPNRLPNDASSEWYETSTDTPDAL